jgi:hypothetical protein
VRPSLDARFRGHDTDVLLDPVFLASAKRRIRTNDIDPFVLVPGNQRPGQRVVVAHEARILDAMQQHVGDAEHVRKLLLLHRAKDALHFLTLRGRSDVGFLHVEDRAGEKASRSVCRSNRRWAGSRRRGGRTAAARRADVRGDTLRPKRGTFDKISRSNAN